MSLTTVRCPLPRCGAENPLGADRCSRCGLPVRGYATLSTYAAYLFNQGLAAAREGRLGPAREYFAAVVHWCPADTEARNALALAAFELGEADEAREHWERVRQRQPGDPLASWGLSRVAGDPG
jgi:tetratricopeptide (TPR) repeat protein